MADALQDAAMRVGADVPGAIRLTAEARSHSQVGARRLLVVGVAAMPFLTETEFRVLLARALARCSNQETWYSIQAQRVEMPAPGKFPPSICLRDKGKWTRAVLQAQDGSCRCGGC